MPFLAGYILVVGQEKILSAIVKIIGVMATWRLEFMQAYSMNPVMYVNTHFKWL
jgi:hypothetical protein